MATLGTLKNTRTLHPQCQITLYRFTRIDPSANLTVETPCSICMIPGEFCNLIQETREWGVENPLADWSLTFDDADQQTALESILVAYTLVYDSVCHWIASDNASGGGLTFTFSWDLEVTVNGSDGDLVDLSLDVTIDISDGYADSFTVTYEKTGVDPFSVTAQLLAATTSTIFDLPATDEIVFPDNFSVTIDDPIWS